MVVATLIGNVRGGRRPRERPDIDHYVGRGLRPLVGRTVEGQQLVTAFSYNAAKLVSAESPGWRATTPTLRSGEDHVYWLALFARRQFRLRVV